MGRPYDRFFAVFVTIFAFLPLICLHVLSISKNIDYNIFLNDKTKTDEHRMVIINMVFEMLYYK